MTRARDMANLGSQAGSGLDASDITTGTLGNTVQDNITRLGTVTTDLTLTGDLETATNKKIKQKGAFMQSSTHQSWVMGG